jgi:hypothetical protein
MKQWMTWNALCATFIVGGMACGFCSNFKFGNGNAAGTLPDKSWGWVDAIPGMDAAPAAAANLMLLHFTRNLDGTKWAHCSLCKHADQRNRRAAYLVAMAPSYLTTMLGVVRSDPIALQLLSVIDVRLYVTKRWNQFVRGELARDSLLDCPVVVAGDIPVPAPIPEAVSDMLVQLLRSNRILQRYLSMGEQPVPSLGMSIISPSMLSASVRRARDRGPVQIMPDTVRQVLGILEYEQRMEPSTCEQDLLFQVGSMFPRGAGDAAQSIWAGVDGIAAFVQGGAGPKEPSVERAVFAYIFPHDRGAYDGEIPFQEYMRMRMLSVLWSPFTLNPLYVLLRLLGDTNGESTRRTNGDVSIDGGSCTDACGHC